MSRKETMNSEMKIRIMNLGQPVTKIGLKIKIKSMLILPQELLASSNPKKVLWSTPKYLKGPINLLKMTKISNSKDY